jgi:hypothetical protein
MRITRERENKLPFHWKMLCDLKWGNSCELIGGILHDKGKVMQHKLLSHSRSPKLQSKTFSPQSQELPLWMLGKPRRSETKREIAHTPKSLWCCKLQQEVRKKILFLSAFCKYFMKTKMYTN